ncbi:unnamed protein product [Lactuca virosa]|uniref:Uncharacterized protein n=1 Tax=Lactuca virosa TaxID=75947 RepID=A0AAU9P707_9ASTR|nr:unnamed protein product [Lactuca virosa]
MFPSTNFTLSLRRSSPFTDNISALQVQLPTSISPKHQKLAFPLKEFHRRTLKSFMKLPTFKQYQPNPLILKVSEIAKEDQQFERKRKRVLALTQWKWDEVADLCLDDDEEEDVIQTKKKVRVCIHNRNRTMKLLDESDVEA